MYNRIRERLTTLQNAYYPKNIANQNVEHVSVAPEKADTPIETPVVTQYVETNYDGNSFITQFGGGLVAAHYNIQTNLKRVDDFSYIPDQHRESIHCTQESVKQVISDEYGKSVCDTVQGQNNYQSNAGQVVTPTVIIPFQQWPLSHDVLNEFTTGQATYAQRKYLDGLNHVRIGYEFTKAGQYSGTFLHGLGNAQSMFASLGSQAINGSMTRAQREEVEFAFFTSQNVCQGRRKKAEKEIREERKCSYMSQQSTM